MTKCNILTQFLLLRHQLKLRISPINFDTREEFLNAIKINSHRFTYIQICMVQIPKFTYTIYTYRIYRSLLEI